MLKTFQTCVFSEQQIGSIHAYSYADEVDRIDKEINDYAESHNLVISSVSYQYVTTTKQNGTASYSIEQRVFYMAAVIFSKP